MTSRRGAKADPIVLGRRYCAGCGRWRPIHDFPFVKKKPAVSSRSGWRQPKICIMGTCETCKRVRERERYRRDPAPKLQKSREYRERNREYLNAKRRNDPEYRKRDAEAKRKRYREKHGEPKPRRALRDVDYEAHLAKRRAWYADKMANDPVWREGRREYARIYQEAKRREQGSLARTAVIKRRKSAPVQSDPKLPLAPFQKWIRERAEFYGRGDQIYGHAEGAKPGMGELAQRCEIAARTLRRFLDGYSWENGEKVEFNTLPLATVDTCLTNEGSTFIWELYTDDELDKASELLEVA